MSQGPDGVTPPTPLVLTPLTLNVFAVTGIGEVGAGDDLAAIVVAACEAGQTPLEPGDVVCVSSKVVSKSLGLTGDDHDGAVAADTRALVAARRTPRGVTRVVRSAAGPVMAAAGVDESNTGPGGGVLRLPADPDAQARRLRRDLGARLGFAPAVVVTDTAGRPWRDGQTDFALGVAGLAPVDDTRGLPDADGRLMAVTVRALADEVAAAADLVKGKIDGRPVAVVRGLGGHVGEDGPGAARLVRDPADDWFGRGDVEAVHAALGLSAAEAAEVLGSAGAPPARLPGDPAETLRRAVAVARSGHAVSLDARIGEPVAVLGQGWQVDVEGEAVAVGRLVERLLVAAQAERLQLAVRPLGPHGVRVGTAAGA